MAENLLCHGSGTGTDPDRPHLRCLRTPPRVLGETFKQAPKHKGKDGKQLEL